MTMMLTVRDESERSREPDFGDVVPVRVEDEGEVPVEGDPRPRRDFAAVSATERGLDERGDVLSLDLREQVQVLVIASEKIASQSSQFAIEYRILNTE